MVTTKRFYVYDPMKWEFGGVRTSLEGEPQDAQKVVHLTEAAAAFWIEQGVIGEKPLGERAEKAQGLTAQMLGTAEEIAGNPPPAAPPAGGKAPKAA